MRNGEWGINDIFRIPAEAKRLNCELRIPRVAAATRHVLRDIETFSRYVLKTPLYAYQLDPALWQKKEELERLQAQDGRQRVFIVGPDQVRGCPEKALS